MTAVREIFAGFCSRRGKMSSPAMTAVLLKVGLSENEVASVFKAAGVESEDVDLAVFFSWLAGRPSAFRSSQHFRLFLCQQQTTLAYQYLATLGESVEIRASTTAFNVRRHPLPNGCVGYDVPCFGSIPAAVVAIFTPDMRARGPTIQAKVPEFGIDTFVQVKTKKILDLVIEGRRAFRECSEANAAAFGRVETFARAFAALRPEDINTMQQWHGWVEQFVSVGWQERLHYDDLLGNFGFDEEMAHALRKLEHTEVQNNMSIVTTLEHHAMRWLGKALGGYKPLGCLTDVVNLVFAMMGQSAGGHMQEQEVVATLREFSRLLVDQRTSTLWIPTHLLHDAEVDDMLVWLLLDHIHSMKGTTLYVKIQLPPDEALAQQEELWNRALEEPSSPSRSWSLMQNSVVMRDPSSGNLQALLNSFGLDN